jgi:hypothetical protein
LLHDSLGWVEFRMGNKPEALRILREAFQRLPDAEIADLARRSVGLMRDCGLEITSADEPVITDPAGFHALFPGSGGALYGRANHGIGDRAH